MTTELRGSDFIALRRLSTPDDETLARVGETCDRVPVESLAPLLASGKIVARPPTDDQKRQDA